MHEFTIATNIVSIVEDALRKRDSLDSSVEQVEFVAGRLNAVIPQFLRENFDHLKKEKKFLRDAELVIREKPIIIRCGECGAETEIDEPVFWCGRCSSGNIEVISGKEMYVDSIQVE